MALKRNGILSWRRGLSMAISHTAMPKGTPISLRSRVSLPSSCLGGGATVGKGRPAALQSWRLVQFAGGIWLVIVDHCGQEGGWRTALVSSSRTRLMSDTVFGRARRRQSTLAARALLSKMQAQSCSTLVSVKLLAPVRGALMPGKTVANTAIPFSSTCSPSPSRSLFQIN